MPMKYYESSYCYEFKTIEGSNKMDMDFFSEQLPSEVYEKMYIVLNVTTEILSPGAF